MGWEGWLAIIGGVIAAIGQWQVDWYLPVIGGIVAIIGGIGEMSK